MSGQPAGSLLDRLIAEAQADDYALASTSEGRHRPGVPALVALLVIGLLLAVAFTQRQAVGPVAQERRQALVERVRAAEQDVAQSQDRAAELRRSVAQLQVLATRGLGPEFADRLRQVEIASGFVGLAGPGAVITMRDGTPPLPKGVSAEEARVLDVDMQMVVNGLWQAGAQAVAVNGIRLTSTTAIRTAGQAILVDFRPLLPPYTVEAVGPADLAERFADTPASSELSQLRQDYGIQSKVSPAEEVEVPASTSNLPIRAEVVEGGGR